MRIQERPCLSNSYFRFVSGRKQAPRFLCEVRVPSYSYVGVGNSTTKKEAQFNAAKDFIQFLVRQGKIDEKDLPSDVGTFWHQG